jgi:integrase
MKGCRAFTDQEAQNIMESFRGAYAARDRAIFVIGRYAGERITAILSLKVGDVVQGGRIVEKITFRRANRKGKTEGRTVVLHPEPKSALKEWLDQLAAGGYLTAEAYVFQSRKGQNKPISRIQFYRVLKNAATLNKIDGKIVTHSMRKTFADRVYDALGQDIFRTQKALGHKNINSTAQYLSFREEDIDQAVLGM